MLKTCKEMGLGLILVLIQVWLSLRQGRSLRLMLYYRMLRLMHHYRKLILHYQLPV